MSAARDKLKEVFGYEAFRPGQEETVQATLAGRDVLAVMPTGAGKSVCYQIPALLLPGITLVISPLISLMRDQVSALTQNGVSAAYLNSSLTPRQHELALRNAREGRYRIIYVAPERLTSQAFLDFALGASIAQVVVDEAHCVSQWGQDFRPGYLNIAAFIAQLPERPPVSAFTATATRAVRKDIVELLELRSPREVSTGFDRPNLYFEVRRPQDRDAELVRALREREGQSGIVYCGTRKGVEQVTRLLTENGVDAVGYHAGMDDAQRRQAQEDFVSDRIPVIVATNAFGMGIDKSNVSFVIHYNMPKDLESYYQEAGRAGRDGEDAACCLLYKPADVRLATFLIEHGQEDSQLDEATRAVVTQRAKERLKQMTFYATGAGCLRARILRYFGQADAEENCGNCSFCLGLSDAKAKDAQARREEKPVRAPRGRAGARTRSNVRPAVNAKLFARLSARRRQIAQEQRVPPFIIFTNATLRDMAVKRPKTRAQMLRVEGVGENKLARYGDAFLEEIARFEGED